MLAAGPLNDPVDPPVEVESPLGVRELGLKTDGTLPVMVAPLLSQDCQKQMSVGTHDPRPDRWGRASLSKDFDERLVKEGEQHHTILLLLRAVKGIG